MSVVIVNKKKSFQKVSRTEKVNSSYRNTNYIVTVMFFLILIYWTFIFFFLMPLLFLHWKIARTSLILLNFIKSKVNNTVFDINIWSLIINVQIRIGHSDIVNNVQELYTTSDKTNQNILSLHYFSDCQVIVISKKIFGHCVCKISIG